MNKYKKQFNLILRKKNIIVSSPLGKLITPLPQEIIIVNSSNNNDKLFVPKVKIIFFRNLINSLFNSVKYGWFFEFSLKGKGFKLFKYNNYLSFDLGYSNLFLFKFLNKDLQLFTINQTVIIFGLNKSKVFSFISLFKKFYYNDKYNGKGLFFKNEKSYIINKKLI